MRLSEVLVDDGFLIATDHPVGAVGAPIGYMYFTSWSFSRGTQPAVIALTDAQCRALNRAKRLAGEDAVRC